MSSCRLYLRLSLLFLAAFVVSVIAAPAGEQKNVEKQLDTDNDVQERLTRNVRGEGGLKAKGRKQGAAGRPLRKGTGAKRRKGKKEGGVGGVRRIKGVPRKKKQGRGKGAKVGKIAVSTKVPAIKPKGQTGRRLTNTKKPEHIGLIG